MTENAMTKPTEQQIQDARECGQEAGDRRNAPAVENPYDAAEQRELHDAWEDGRQDGIRNH